MDEIETLQAELTAGAERRGIRIAPALFAEASVTLIHEATTVDEVLDIIQHSFTPFITIETSYIDRDDVEQKFRDNEDDDVPAEVTRILNDHENDLAHLAVHWVAAGVIFRYSAMPAWRHELGEALEEREESERAHRYDEVRDYWIRVTALSEQLELMPEYRVASSHSRANVGKNLFDERLRGPEDGIMMEKHVLEAASKRVRENAESQYAQVDITDSALVDQLRATTSWRTAHTAADRDEAARAFLVKLTGGYAPRLDMVKALRRRAASLPPLPNTR